MAEPTEARGHLLKDREEAGAVAPPHDLLLRIAAARDVINRVGKFQAEWERHAQGYRKAMCDCKS